MAGINGTSLTIYKSRSSCLIPNGPQSSCSPEFDEIWQTTLDVSGPGIALVTQKDGSIYLFALDADDPGTYNKMYLYKLDIQNKTFSKFTARDMPVPSMSDSIIYLQHYIAAIMVFNAIIWAPRFPRCWQRARVTSTARSAGERGSRSRIARQDRSVRHGSERLATFKNTAYRL